MKQLAEKFDYESLQKIYDSLPFDSHQVHVSSPDGSTYVYESGDLSKQKLNQNDFTIVNEMFRGTYVEEVYNELDKKYNICRGRFMRLDPSKPSYTYHYDISNRLHIPLQTNSSCYFMENKVRVEMKHLGQLYELETVFEHSAFNESEQPRIHFVVCRKANETMIEHLRSVYATST